MQTNKSPARQARRDGANRNIQPRDHRTSPRHAQGLAPSRAAQSELTRMLATVLAAFRPVCSTFEVSTSIAAAVLVENEKRPFGTVATRMLARIFHQDERDSDQEPR